MLCCSSHYAKNKKDQKRDHQDPRQLHRLKAAKQQVGVGASPVAAVAIARKRERSFNELKIANSRYM